MMNRFCRFGVLTFLLLFVTQFSFAQKTKPDLGVLRQNTYTNDFFEMKIEFPIGWLVGDNGLEGQLVTIQKQMLEAKNSKNQKMVNAAVNQVTPLLGGYKYLPGSEKENSNLRVMVENISGNRKIKTSRQYLNAALATMRLVKLPDFKVSEITSGKIGNKQIDYLETKYLNNLKRTYAFVKKGYAVLITIDAYTQKDFDALHKVLTEADLDYKKGN